MKRLSMLCVAAALILGAIGCEAKDRNTIVKESETAAGHAGQAVDAAMTSLEQDLDGISARSSEADIAAARQQAIQKRDQLKTKSGVNQDAMKQLGAQIDRLGAALDVKKLQGQSEAFVKQAQKAGESLDDVRKRLEQTSAAFKDLQNRAQQAMQRYDSLAAQVSGKAERSQP
jgi:cell division septum initiation protein DivIVA